MKAFSKTDIGKMRNMNQDCIYVSPDDENIKLYILADGMGGYNGGEVASSLAVDSIKNYVNNHFSSIQLDKESILQFLKEAMEYANKVVYQRSREDKELEEMGTTLEVCLIYGDKVFIAHIGDSRVYRIRKNFIRRLTTDHSYVEKLVKDGTITKEQAYTHPKKNMLTQALGCEPKIAPQVIVKGFLKDDILLICSDGLTNMVSENEIYGIIKTNVEKASDALIDRANLNGGYDNVSVIIIKN
ncbi:MAG: Stp1/IreP family PP2C-type Ser/Thr phosphatase [Clostridia bacterium]|nr:Stp1/IreP family PP2C-type Ser/Thr phosphatase [Clostridia bacterium]